MRICLRCRASIIRKRRKISDENERTVSCHLPLFNYGEPGQSPRAVLASRKRFCSCNAAVFLLVFLGANFEFTACKVVPRLSVYCCRLFEKICRQYLDGQKELCLARTEQKITAKALELEFEKFEKTETMDAIRRTNVSSMGSGNVGDQLIVIHTLITSLLSVLYALFFLLRLFLLSDSSRNNFFTSSFSMLALLLLCGVQLALSSRINRRSTQKKIELNQGNDHSNSVANYLVNVMLEERRADDIRIGHLDHFLDVQFGKAMEHFLPMYLDFARFSAITDGKNALLSLLSNFAAYFLLSIMLHCTTKRPVWAIHCRHSPKILKDGQKTEDFSLHFVRLSTTYLLDSPFTEMMN